MSLAKESWKFGQPRFIDDGEDALYVEFPDRTVKYVPERTCEMEFDFPQEVGFKQIDCRCSECWHGMSVHDRYCSECGAKVVGE